MKTLGDRIRHARKLRDLSQNDVGRVLSVSREAVSLWEANTNAPTMDRLGPLAKLLGVPAEWLLKGGPLDPKSLRPVPAVEDELTDFVAALHGKHRKRALAMLKMLVSEPEDEPPGEKKVA